MVRGFADGAALHMTASRRHVDFAAEDRFHATLLGMIVKNHRREHVAVLGNCQRGHLQPGRLVEQLVYTACTVEERVLGVQMKMNESLISHCLGEIRALKVRWSRYY